MTDQMREQFEAWVADQAANGVFFGGVTEQELDIARAAWQASRAALVVELPADDPLGSGEGDFDDGRPSFEQHCAAACNAVLQECREAIEAVGVTVKVKS